MESIGQINIDVDRKIDNLIQLMSNVRYVVVSCANVLVHEHVVAAGGAFSATTRHEADADLLLRRRKKHQV